MAPQKGVFSTVEGAIKQQVKRAQNAKNSAPQRNSGSGEKGDGKKAQQKSDSLEKANRAPIVTLNAEPLAEAQTPRFAQTLKPPLSASASTTTTPFPPASPVIVPSSENKIPFSKDGNANLLESLQAITERLQAVVEGGLGETSGASFDAERPKLATRGSRKRRSRSASDAVPLVPSTTDTGAAREESARGDQAVPQPPRNLQALRTSSRTSSDNLLHALLSGAKYTPGPSPQNSYLQEQGISAIMASGQFRPERSFHVYVALMGSSPLVLPCWTARLK